MHYSLWFGDNLLRDVEIIMKATGKKRNTVIREAVEKYVDEWKGKRWSEKIQNFKGVKGFKEEDRFENTRLELKGLRENVFGDGK